MPRRWPFQKPLDVRRKTSPLFFVVVTRLKVYLGTIWVAKYLSLPITILEAKIGTGEKSI